LRRRIHPEYHPNLLLINLNALNECPNDLPARLPISFMQPGLYPRSKLVKTTQDERQFLLQAGFIFDLLGLLFNLLQTFSHTGNPGFKLPLWS
jgi:hypothetical protein